MARLETRWEAGGLNQALQYIQDMTPKRVRAYICTATNEVVIRPRVTSAHSDTMIVRGIPDIGSAWGAILGSGIPKQFVYVVDHIEWAEDRMAIPQYRPPNGG